jgi:hypothetical protein
MGASVAVLAALAVFALDIATQTQSYPGLQIRFGYDFTYLRQALIRSEPYSIGRYVSPPTFPLIGYPLTFLDVRVAAALVSFASLAGIALALAAVDWHYHRHLRADASSAPIWIVFLVLSSYPVYFLVDRGNIDGVICALVWIGLVAANRKRDRLGGSLWGLAVALKLYPLLLIVPLVLARRFRFLAAGALVLVLAVLAQPRLYHTYASTRLLERASLPIASPGGAIWGGYNNLTNAENGSFASALVPLGLSFRQLQIAGAALALGLLIGNALTDFRRGRGELLYRALPYVPLSVSIPSTVYLYEYVTVLPAVLVCGVYARVLRSRLLLAATVALAVSQTFSFTFASLLRMPALHSLSACALLVATIFVTLERASAPAEPTHAH